VERDLRRPLLELRGRGKLAEDDEVRGLEVGGLLGELLDRVAPILQDPLVPSMNVIALRQAAVFMNAGS
jgi:hypothetical protein